MKDHDVEEVLEDLIVIARDGAEGYRLAAAHAHDPSLKQAFNERSGRRSRFVAQLQRLQLRYGRGSQEKSGSFSGTLHRTWMNVRSVINEQKDQALVEEAERGEDAALTVYREALQHDPTLPMDALACVKAQAWEVKEDHAYLCKLRDCGRFEKRNGSPG